jgi:hypothetical protein
VLERIAMAEQDHEPKSRDTDIHETHESDRRGEHKYPETEQEKAERPSQRERDELVERLERKS